MAGAVVALALVGFTTTTGPAAAARPASAVDQAAVIRDWNAIATETISASLGPRPSAQVVIWHGFVSLAVYNAVVGITGDYAPYKWQEREDSTASPEAAAATAAHDVLLTYFPASQPRLDSAYADSLAAIPAGPAKDQGVSFGKRAAEHVVELREDDGRFADVPFTEPPAPGVWRPTPPTFQPFIDTWLAKLRPLLVTSSSQFRPGEPPALASARYAQDFNEVKSMGAKTAPSRTPEETQTALFFSGSLAAQLQSAFRDYSARHELGITQTARLFAAVNSSITDAAVTAWNTKLYYASWRPISAIRLADTDGNPATAADPAWEPLLVTPPHPDYLAGHPTVAAAAMRAATSALGVSRLDLHVPSEVTGTTRYYASADAFNRDVINARVWGGVHTRTADVTGCRVGDRIGAWALTHFFRPTRTVVSSAQQSAPQPGRCG
ncbi:vanadium-dependent haloperoxidase [Streptomyces sp. NPDC046805]|uniref:vanadium-dependent haloperoxidase n=1 Tax=Streptomyces sp. NPDC046805 TaxID=3155134 RepID=UPI0033F7F155